MDAGTLFPLTQTVQTLLVFRSRVGMVLIVGRSLGRELESVFGDLEEECGTCSSICGTGLLAS